MTSSIQKKIILLLMFILLIFFTAIFFQEEAKSRMISYNLENLKAEKNLLLKKTITIKGQRLNDLVFDYTYWDEMVDFVRTKDAKWSAYNIDTGMKTYFVDKAWIFNETLELIYSASSDGENTVPVDFPIEINILKNILSKNYFQHFYVLTNSGLLEIRTAPIQSSEDIQRISPPKGFMIGGLTWSDKHISEIEFLVAGKLHLVPVNEKWVDPENKSVICVCNPLKNWNEKEIGLVYATFESPIMDKLISSSKQQYIFILGFLILVFGVMTISLFILVIRPIHIISEGLESENPDILSKLSKKSSEFGYIALLIKKYFIQKKKLVREIRYRKKAEKSLQKAHDELEMRVKERTKELAIKNKELKAEIKERLKAEKSLRKAKESAEKANKAKSEFITNVSHEIRTPLNGIIGFGQLLKNNITEPKYRTYVDGILASGTILLSLINDILDLSKIESGKIEIKPALCNIHKLVLDFKQIFLAKEQEKNIKLTISISQNVPESVLVDEIRIRQILFNLVGNAFKFTEQGFVDLKLDALHDIDAQETLTLIFEVTDSGIGIPKKNHKEIFEAFKQQDGQLTRQYGGTGLGLTITKRLVDCMNGKIELESEEGKGSKFKIYLPEVAKVSLNDNDIDQNKSIEEVISQNGGVSLIENIISNLLNILSTQELKQFKNKFESLWEKASILMSNDDIMEFAGILISYSKKINSEYLHEYASSLYTSAESFDIETMNLKFQDFIEITKNL
ncbi:MAG: hypothetical protein HQK76_05990 [Desulfobacterales bacterium]|nr:hypothetical protein [Desulfobacterales bacterium]